mmetsp:Transcript_31999/g.63883  ORF Transcript_31999/g.63883 Transcript_31999/m.63883 type:complete len:286 (-) Transcript_31999:357-1214(-)
MSSTTLSSLMIEELHAMRAPTRRGAATMPAKIITMQSLTLGPQLVNNGDVHEVGSRQSRTEWLLTHGTVDPTGARSLPTTIRRHYQAIMESRNASCLLGGPCESSSLASCTIVDPPLAVTVASRVSASDRPRLSGGIPHAKNPPVFPSAGSPSWSAISPRACTRWRACALGVSFDSVGNGVIQSVPGTATVSGGTTFSDDDARFEAAGGTSVPRSPNGSFGGAGSLVALCDTFATAVLLLPSKCVLLNAPLYAALPAAMISLARLLPRGVVRGSSPPSSMVCLVQ